MSAFSALFVLGGGWYLGKPGPYGPAIGGAVCVMVAMAENEWRGAVKASGRSWGFRCSTGSLWGWRICPGTTPWHVRLGLQGRLETTVKRSKKMQNHNLFYCTVFVE